MPHVKDIIYYCIDFVNRFFTKNVIFLRDIYQSDRAWKPAPASYSQRLLLEERLRISGGEVVPQGILNKRCKAATPHPSASLTPSPQGEGSGACLLGIYNSNADGARACVSAYNRADEIAIARS